MTEIGPDDGYVFCWKCDSKVHEDDDKCSKCNMPMFDKEGNEIVDQEQYDFAKERGWV